jgi:Ca-activated chloride channel family protein
VGTRALIFTDSSLLFIGGALTGLILVGLWSHGVRRRRLAQFLGGRPALDRFSRSDMYRFGVRRVLLLGLAGVALAGAAADPHRTDAPEALAPVKKVILAIDVSASMQATDASPTRLARAVSVAGRLVDDLEGHEVGLLLYAGRSYPLAPPTRDLNAIRFLLSGVSPTIASSYDPGTLMSEATVAATVLLAWETDSTALDQPADPPPEQMIIFVSDGDSAEPEEAVIEAIGVVREAGIAVHAVGIGTEAGAGMVMPRGTYQMGGAILDANGQPALSRLNSSILGRIASEGGGRYVNGESLEDLDALDADLRRPTVPPEPDPDDSTPAWASYDLPFLLGALALALILLESLFDVTVPRLVSFRAREAT